MKNRRLKTFFKTIYNFFFVLKYPFWRSRNVWSDKPTGYKYTKYEELEYGWQKAFGKQLSKDLKAALKKDKILKEFRFTQIKEKWGRLCLYNNGVGPETKKVIDHYEHLSICFCLHCGKPARYLTTSCVSYVCKDCFDSICDNMNFKNLAERIKYRKNCRLKVKDIPKSYKYINGVAHIVKYDVDYRNFWGLPKSEYGNSRKIKTNAVEVKNE